MPAGAARQDRLHCCLALEPLAFGRAGSTGRVTQVPTTHLARTDRRTSFPLVTINGAADATPIPEATGDEKR